MRFRSIVGLAMALGALAGCEDQRAGFLPEDSGIAPDDVGSVDGPLVTDAGSRDGGVAGDRGGPPPVDAGPTNPGPGDAGHPGGNACGAVDLGSRLGAALAAGSTVGGPTQLEGSCGGDESEEAVYAWTAPSAGRYAFTTDGSDYDTVLYLRDGLCATRELECDDDNDEGVQSTVTVTLRAGQQVTIVVDGYGGDSGDYTLGISRAP